MAAKLLGEKVRALREYHQFTQEKLHELTGISRNQIQNIEHSRNNSKNESNGQPGPGNARLDTIFLLANALRVDVTYLVDPQVPVLPLPTDHA